MQYNCIEVAHVTYTHISLAKTSHMTSLISMWQRCLICVFGRSHQHFYRNTIFKSSHFGCKYLLPFLPQSKHIHPLSKCNINHGIRFGDFLCTSSGYSFAWIYLPPSQSFYIVERARVAPVNTTIYKMEECEVLNNHCSTATLKFFCVDAISAPLLRTCWIHLIRPLLPRRLSCSTWRIVLLELQHWKTWSAPDLFDTI